MRSRVKRLVFLDPVQHLANELLQEQPRSDSDLAAESSRNLARERDHRRVGNTRPDPSG